MRKGTLNITTIIDGNKTEVEYAAQMRLQKDSVLLTYEDGGARVQITFENGVLQIDRQGDYQMQLTLKNGELVSGRLGIGGQSGEVATHTQKLTSKIKQGAWLCTAKYALLIGAQSQMTSVRMYAAVKE